MKHPRRHLITGAVVVLILGSALAACADGEPAAAPATTVGSALGDPVPPLPPDVNAVPYFIDDVVALGNVKLRILDIEGLDPIPTASTVRLEIDIENGALDPVSIDPTSLRLYSRDGSSTTPTADTAAILAATTIPSATWTAFDLDFAVEPSSEPFLLLFDGRSYGERVNSGAIALVEYDGAPADG